MKVLAIAFLTVGLVALAAPVGVVGTASAQPCPFVWGCVPPHEPCLQILGCEPNPCPPPPMYCQPP